MYVELIELFDRQYDITEEVLSSQQRDSAFFVSSAIFFDEVSVFEEFNNELSYEENLEDIKNKVGDFEVVQKWDNYIEITPKDYYNFKLHSKYHADYLMLCESVILTTSLKNLNMLKNIGVEESIQQIPIDYNSARELLRKRHNIARNSIIV